VTGAVSARRVVSNARLVRVMRVAEGSGSFGYGSVAVAAGDFFGGGGAVGQRGLNSTQQ